MQHGPTKTMKRSRHAWSRCVPGSALLAWAATASAAPEYGPPAPSPHDMCDNAIATAEQAVKLPANLARSIARVESGRLDPATGRVRPWPWTINTGGVGSFFATKEEAVAAVEALQVRGVQSIDVGCMQVNLRHHPQAFANLREAFDPETNSRYAVRFLTALHRQTGDWVQATAFYHSQAQDLGDGYVRKVLGPGVRPVKAVPLRLPQEPDMAWPPGTPYGAFMTPDSRPPLAAPGVSESNEGVPGLACPHNRC